MGPNGFVKSVSTEALKMDYSYGATLGRAGSDQIKVAMFGRTPTGAANTDIWEGGGLYPFQATAVVLEAVSDSALDTVAGTGARTIRISGLDANFNMISEIVTLAGVTPVQSTLVYLRVNGVVVVTAGSTGVNQGSVTVRVTGAGATQAIIRPLYGLAKSAVYTIPAGYTLLLTEIAVGCAGTGAADSITVSGTRISPLGLITKGQEIPTGALVPIAISLSVGAAVFEKTSFVLRITDATGTPVSYGSFGGILIINTQLT
jgi:hypothetical protein